jgi:hypothetical protein
MMRDCTVMCNRSGEQVATIGLNEAVDSGKSWCCSAGKLSSFVRPGK